MRAIIIIVICTAFIGACNAQNSGKGLREEQSDTLYFIDNKLINYSIVLLACDTCVPISNIGYRVRVDISKRNLELVKKIGYKKWMELLSSDKSDWAANLILYYIYNKDASLLARRNTRELWIRFLKEDDVDFWKKALKTL